MSAHEPGAAHVAGHEGAHGATELAHEGHGDSAAQLAAAGSAGDSHAAHSADEPERHSAAIDHTGHSGAGHGNQAPEGDHSGHGAPEPNKGGDTGGNGRPGDGDDERERKGVVGSLIGVVEDLQQARRAAGDSPGVPTEPAPTNR